MVATDTELLGQLDGFLFELRAEHSSTGKFLDVSVITE